MRPIWLLMFLLLVSSLQPAVAMEQGLAGVKLGNSALQLLTNPTFGQPSYIGPIGLAVGREEAQAPGAKTSSTSTPGYAGRAGAVSAPASPIGGYSPYSRTPAPGTPPAQAAIPTGTTGAARPVQHGPGKDPVMVWLYKRGLGTSVLIELDVEGKVTGITIEGGLFSTVATARGIRLGDTYNLIVERYGFPDQTANEGLALVIRYLEPGLIFRLVNLKLAAMRLTTRPTWPIPGSGTAQTGARASGQGMPSGVGAPAGMAQPGQGLFRPRQRRQ